MKNVNQSITTNKLRFVFEPLNPDSKIPEVSPVLNIPIEEIQKRQL